MSGPAKLASIDVRARSRRTSSVQPYVALAISYSRGKFVPSRLGSSVFVFKNRLASVSEPRPLDRSNLEAAQFVDDERRQRP